MTSAIFPVVSNMCMRGSSTATFRDALHERTFLRHRSRPPVASFRTTKEQKESSKHSTC
ncbi:unnamed protein product [Amoebophrya sp. A25]|nr:unnamed protein product [Amoebophrya sp. A25]|eukprot:GSA25T00025156001.1